MAMTETLEQKLARINAAAQARLDAKRDEKRAKWERIQAEAPDVAQVLADVARAFGKPASVEVILSSGERIL
jgi:hypothetical protein